VQFQKKSPKNRPHQKVYGAYRAAAAAVRVGAAVLDQNCPRHDDIVDELAHHIGVQLIALADHE